jgi:hypothetical protein
MAFGLRARNLDGCRATLSASVHDACDDAIVSAERRPTRLDPVDGWGIPRNMSYVPILQMCPNAAATRDLEGEPYIVHLAVEDADGRRAEAAPITVVPTCLDDTCLCQCDTEYIVGEPDSCAPEADAGPACP